ncbi:hypothetical protein LOC68_09715 [Blastopirellula sp. JC732]|uniref:Squalene cyclase C-terminal domain-containing protein n=1 Tax=Blastopirellula sediminis TaxID=2894196 RepID=A0A9X1ML31_9BACT|nr:prenyltransferase/squalene oxidase repeat-containing protein [Blastopirellula sediminis]MCC9608549.1 hypothetical protein [Blastopirellula sediminis]MCC9628674.1 hypothetical protein [Blastopirellula sediminis]
MSSEEHPKDRNKSPEKRPAPISQPPTPPPTLPASGDEAKAPISFGHAPPQQVPNYFPPQGQFPQPPQYPPSQYPQPGQYGPPGQYPPAGPYPPQGQYPPQGSYPPPGQYPPTAPYGAPGYPGQYPTQWPSAPQPPGPPTPPPTSEAPLVPPSAPVEPPAMKSPAPQQPAPAAPKPPTSPSAKQPPAAKQEKPRDPSEKQEPPKWRGETKPAKKQTKQPGEKKAAAKETPNATPAAKPAESPKSAPPAKPAPPASKREEKTAGKPEDKSAPVEKIPTDRKGLPRQAPKRTAPEIVSAELQVSEHEAPAEDLTAKSTRMMPPWMISTIAHFVLVLALAMFVFTPRSKQNIVVEATYAERLGEQLDMMILDEDDLMEDDVVGFDITLFESEQPPPEALTTLAATGTKSRQEEVEKPGVEFNFRGEGGGKKALLKAYGGTATTEQSVKEALDWLKRNQRRDGSWSLKGPYKDGAGIENHIAATAMALLAFQGAGHTTVDGAYTKEVSRGWDFLLSQMDNDGTFISGEMANQHRLYTQAQATIALCELYGMTKDEKYRKPAQRAIDYAVRIQSPEGGWRYTPGDGADTSVTGWFVIAFASAKMCGLNVPEDTLQRVGGFLDSVAKENGARYTYQPTRNQPPTLSMTAEGLLCRQYLGWKQEDPRLQDGVDFLVSNPVNWKEPDVYYWYYGTQVAHHFEGSAWQNWNKVMRQAIPEQQVKVGSDKGSWSPDGDKHGVIGGRLFMTCLCVYMLEVYYRHLPIYSKSEVLSLQ